MDDALFQRIISLRFSIGLLSHLLEKSGSVHRKEFFNILREQRDALRSEEFHSGANEIDELMTLVDPRKRRVDKGVRPFLHVIQGGLSETPSSEPSSPEG